MGGGHVCVLHGPRSLAGPSHRRPPCFGVVQDRVLTPSPPSQVAEQSTHGLHSSHFPWTGQIISITHGRVSFLAPTQSEKKDG